MSQKATLIGFSAILMWSLLALFTAGTQGIPQFQLLGLTFSIASIVGLAFIFRKGRDGVRKLKQPLSAWVIGVGGLFGYHFLYFTALSNAPVVDASLIAYLWPLLIVIFSALLPGEKLRCFHILGAVSGFIGASLLILEKGGISFSSQFSLGYMAAMACALTWSLYSILNRTQGNIPTETVAGFCIFTALFAFICHGLFESWVMPEGMQWLAIAALGLGPVGAAFYTWDYATKHGNIKMLGVLSYGAPLFSTIFLTVAGQTNPTWNLGAACLLITGGAVLASLDFFKAR